MLIHIEMFNAGYQVSGNSEQVAGGERELARSA